MQNNKDHKGNWIKVILGAILLFGRLRRSKETGIRKNQTMDKNKNYQENDKSLMQNSNITKELADDMRGEAQGWLKAQPENLPSPTYWPFFLALGLAFLLWGIITSWVIVAVGLLIFIIALSGWINILRHER